MHEGCVMISFTNEPVEVAIWGSLDVEVAATDVVDGLVVDHEGAVGVLQGGVGGQDGVVGLHHRRGNLNNQARGIGSGGYYVIELINIAAR